MIKRPEASEYPAYYLSYVDLVPKGDIVSILNQQKNEMIESLKDLTNLQGLFQYASDKWTVKAVESVAIISFRTDCLSRKIRRPI
ncbi:hypothetical protein [Cytobacillus dafuensis]|uniref:Uncharacterized protein n=1 Tax=Cytobacillus dafuensis TaxID=1742359 RepID=A0A5B8Z4W2_CYTDA|nr:hypothetical protein [Cytobacillus dafuensis]QED46679.1 hypothetical protein FSZ17_04970 [Cytobacillus dafuensis]